MCLTKYYTLFLLINTLLAALLGIFVGILFYRAKGPGLLLLTTGVVARIWCFHRCDPDPISGRETKPCSKPLQDKVNWDHNVFSLFRFALIMYCIWAFLVAQGVKNMPAMQETWVRSLPWEDPLEKGKATHSSIFAWRISWTEEPGRLQYTGLQRVAHNWAIAYWMCSLPFCRGRI